MDKKTEEKTEVQTGEVVEPAKGDATTKTFTQEEVTAMLDKQQKELREKAVTTLMEKNAEIKKDMLLSGQDDFYNIAKWEVMKKMATDMVASNALPKADNAYTVMMKMQAGREMGMKPIESIKAFYIVNGVLSIYGDAVIRRLREHGWTLLPYKESQDTCTATICKGDEEFSETFTFQEAEKSGWTKDSYGKLKAGWVDGINRKRKLRYGAMSTLIKTYVPEVLGAASDIAEVAVDTVPLYENKGTDATQTAFPASPEDNEPATEAQKKTIMALANKNGIKVDVSEMTQATAKAWIAGVNQK